jgi:hypothetical protein
MKPHLAITLALAGLAHAQVYTQPPASKPAETPAPVSDTASPPAAKDAKNPLGQEIPLLDPSAETITVGGVAIPLGDNRLLKARFEKFPQRHPGLSWAKVLGMVIGGGAVGGFVAKIVGIA